ncbi:MAG: selenocysteine-specific translation elongation factor [Actinobacteria bacterium]|nr:MAG: selenocysteine-specific translation elongation factor [Actinomycetota bacterium]
MGNTLCLGTAGHIDHGKTTLVEALTGKNTDRLPQEQARGISIDLGYAPLELPDGRRLSVIDVPGHERFVRTMVAGATGIDLFLLVIDAAEGARPQTHEHLAILRLLGIERGVVAVTKSDTVDEETLELALAEAAELVPGAPAVPVSARTGAGLDELREMLASTAASVAQHDPDSRPARLYVDRAFTLRGIGTVVTGTLWSGSIGEGDELRVEPLGRDVRVRSVQVHDRPVERAEPGQRVAVSLPGVERHDLRRGDALVAPHAFPVSYRLDVALEALGEIPARVHVHHGTADIPARVARAGDGYAQLRLAAPVVAARGDRVVLRAGTTVGGGRVVDPAPPRHADAERIALLERGDVAATIHAPVRVEDLRHVLDDGALTGVEQAAGWAFSRAWLDELRAGLEARIAAADPLDPGVPGPAEPWAAAVEPRLGLERRGAKLYLPGTSARLGEREAEAAALEARLGLEPVRVDDATLARYLEEQGRLVRVGDGLAVSRPAYDDARGLLVEECKAAGRITLGRFRDLIGGGRKTAQLLLERFDADGLTRRVGDARVLRRTGSATSVESSASPR